MRRCVMLALLLAAPAAAQEAPSMVPLEFVELLSFSPAGPTTPMVGQLPDDLSSVLRPGPETRIVGTMASRALSLSVLVVPGNARDVAAEWTSRLTQAGWSKPPSMRPQTRGGFASENVPADEDGGVLCSSDNSSAIALQAAPREADSVTVIVVHYRGPFAGQCMSARAEDPRRRLGAPIPTLEAPPGVRQSGGGSGSTHRDGDAHTRLITDMPVAEVGAHYATQMQNEGWTPGTASFGPEVYAQPFARTVDGARWHSVLTVSALAAGRRAVHLRLVQVDQ